MTRIERAETLERHANDYVDYFDKGHYDKELLDRAITLIGQAERIRTRKERGNK